MEKAKEADKVYIVIRDGGKIDSVHRTLEGAREYAASLLSLSLCGMGIAIRDTEDFMEGLMVSDGVEEVYALTLGNISTKVCICYDIIQD